MRNKIFSKVSSGKININVMFLLVLTIFVFGGLGYLFRQDLRLSITRFIPTLKKGTNVSVSFSEEASSSFIYRTQGKEISLTNQTGDEQSLTIEKNALLNSEDISVNSIDEISGLPSEAQFITGLHISGDAILINPATISLEVSDDYQVENIMGFAYDNEGDDWHLYPVTIENNIASMNVSHFSGYGLIAINSDYEDLAEPDSVRAQAEQNLARIQAEIATGQFTGEQDMVTDEQYKRMENILRVWYKTGVIKHLDRAQTDDEQIMIAAKEFFIWLGAVNVIGKDQSFSKEINEGYAMLSKAMNNAIDKSYEKCQGKDATQAGRLMKLYALAQALEDRGVVGINVEGIRDKAYKCANFNLRISATGIDNGGSGCVDGVEKYTGLIELVMDPEERSISGEGKVTGSVEHCGKTCRVTRGSLDKKVKVPQTVVDLESGQSRVEIILELDLDTNVEVDCSYSLNGMDIGLLGSNGSSWINFLYDHKDIELIDENQLLITNWDILGKGEVYARKKWTNTSSFSFYDQEEMIMELVHMPK